MPPWPSMLTNNTSRTNYFAPAATPPQVSAVSSTPLITPVSASSVRSGSTARRTLSEDERRKMCQYHAENPTKKQTEIGAMFGVERSTVSKVLRQKDKYLPQERQEEGSHSPAKRAKRRSPDVERALTVWIENPQQKGRTVSDDEIREKARYFSSVPGRDLTPLNPANNTVWLENFKRKNGLIAAASRKDSLAADDSNLGSLNVGSNCQSPNGISPVSSKETMSPSPPLLHGVRSNESLSIDGQEDYADLRHPNLFTDMPTTTFSHPALMSPTSPFFTPDSANTAFSSLDHYIPASGNSLDNTYHSSTLDPSHLEALSQPLDSISEAMDTEPPSTIPSAARLMPAPPVPSHRVFASAQQGLGSETPPSPIETRLAAALVASGASGSDRPPSQDEARQALQVVMRFFQQQPVGSLDMAESMLLGKIGERLTQELKRTKKKTKKNGGGSGSSRSGSRRASTSTSNG
ncbi:hypothetical protein MBLNU459_g1645t2 [Dothideomycetes sp. NU459]